jgi:hypothetical protein
LPEKGEKKKKKNPGINPGQRHFTEGSFAIENAEAGSAIECKARIVTSQTDRQTNTINIVDLKETPN